jgi:hypothetical protein
MENVMTDTQPGGAQALPAETHAPFPGARLLCAIGYAFLAWFVLWFLFAIGVVQFVMFAINGRVNEELKNFSLSLVQYLWELLAYVTFVRDDQPFPVGPFPRHV